MNLKLKLAIYNTALMTILVVLVLGFVMMASKTIIAASTQSQLEAVVHESAIELEYDDGLLDVDDVSFYNQQVFTLIYSQGGYLLAGDANNQLLEPLVNGQVVQVSQDGTTYLLYDLLVDLERGESVYVRGLISTSASSYVLHEVFALAVLILPAFILLSAIGSYILCKKSLNPLDRMIDTAEKISHDDDLSLRLHLEQGHDEVSRLATTFDQMMEKLEAMMRSEKQFTSDASHELRTPVSVILAECELAQGGDAEESQQALQGIQRQATQMKVLINQLLQLVRLENGIQKPERQPVDMSELVTMICEEHRLLLPKHIHLHCNVEPGVTHLLDYAMLSRALGNLISNSVNYIGDGRDITVTLQQQESTITLCVQDDGLGISPDQLPHIFTRFYTVDKSRTQSQSLGLGLAMVKQLVERNGGRIQVESQINIGSIFTIIFEKESVTQ